MSDTFKNFKKNVEIERLNLSRLFFSYSGSSYDDHLRPILVNGLSALDRFVHDFVVDGIMNIYLGHRPETKKYLTIPLPISMIKNFNSLSEENKEIQFRSHIYNLLGYQSFQSSDRISDALSYITNKKHKWQVIARHINKDEDILRNDLDSIVDRRNKIVHQYDLDFITKQRYSIDRGQVDYSLNVIHDIGIAIFSCFETE